MSFLSSVLSFILSWQGFAAAVASVLLAVVIFLMGIRSGKDSADRAALRELYQKLYSHFKDLSESMETIFCCGVM